jgi:hypothetical protein
MSFDMETDRQDIDTLQKSIAENKQASLRV